MIVVLMGVCGCGKTSVGRALADELRWAFIDADDLHPEANVAKMAAGWPLDDSDRWPWLDRIAGEAPGQTLQPTALVHEAYLRLVDVDQAQHWNSRGHFFAACAEAMRRILVEAARRKRRPKHGGDRQRIDLEAEEGSHIPQEATRGP